MSLFEQIGGNHYKKWAIQPVEYCMKNGLDHCQSNVVKYVTRFRDKGGLQDLQKAKHYLDLLIHFEEYENAPKANAKEKPGRSEFGSPFEPSTSTGYPPGLPTGAPHYT